MLNQQAVLSQCCILCIAGWRTHAPRHTRQTWRSKRTSGGAYCSVSSCWVGPVVPYSPAAMAPSFTALEKSATLNSTGGEEDGELFWSLPVFSPNTPSRPPPLSLRLRFVLFKLLLLLVVPVLVHPQPQPGPIVSGIVVAVVAVLVAGDGS